MLATGIFFVVDSSRGSSRRRHLFDINILLREGYFDVVSVEHIVDTLHHVAHHIDLVHRIHSAQQFEVDAAVAEIGEYYLHFLLRVEETVV